MFKNAFALPAFLLFIYFGNTFAQIAPSSLPSINAGMGVLIFNGDVGKNNAVSLYSRMKAGYNVAIEQRFGKVFSVALTGIYGKLSDTDNSITTNRNFESKIIQGDLSIIANTDKLLPTTSVTPYLGAGLGFLSFDPYGDLLNKNGEKYFYWTDGSIRDKSQSTKNTNSSNLLQHDYVYETQLKDSTKNYARHTVIIPLTFGFNFKILDNLNAKLAVTYFLTFSDYIDNYKANGNNDAYVYTNVSLSYTLKPHAKATPDDKRYDNIDFSKLDEEIIPKK